MKGYSDRVARERERERDSEWQRIPTYVRT